VERHNVLQRVARHFLLLLLLHITLCTCVSRIARSYVIMLIVVDVHAGRETRTEAKMTDTKLHREIRETL
jgi:hypothetical protein